MSYVRKGFQNGAVQLVVNALAEELGLCHLLDQSRHHPKLMSGEDPHDDWVSRVLVLITNRLTQPASEHGLAAWLESYFISDRGGRRYHRSRNNCRLVKVAITLRGMISNKHWTVISRTMLTSLSGNSNVESKPPSRS